VAFTSILYGSGAGRVIDYIYVVYIAFLRGCTVSL